MAGIGCDIAGAVIIAWSLAATNASKISHDVPIHGMSSGLPHIALRSASQRAEARLGIMLLVGGFLLQATTYFFPHPKSSLHTTPQRLIGVGLLVLAWILATITYKVYVPWSAQRVYDQAQRLQQTD
jgi:uncharacterized membrane protein (DUF485 family)